MRWPLSNEATAAIVGDAYVARDPSKTEAYRWTAAGGYQLLGDLGSASSGSAAYAASFDGSVVVGEAPVGTNTFGAFRWTASQGMMALPLPMIFAYAVTDDGTMVAGENNWWKTSGQTGNFGSCSDAQLGLSMVDLSADGSVAAGSGPFGTPFMGDFFNALPASACRLLTRWLMSMAFRLPTRVSMAAARPMSSRSWRIPGWRWRR